MFCREVMLRVSVLLCLCVASLIVCAFKVQSCVVLVLWLLVRLMVRLERLLL